MSANEKNVFEIDKFGRVIIHDHQIITQVAGALENPPPFQDDNTACGDGACHDDAACG